VDRHVRQRLRLRIRLTARPAFSALATAGVLAATGAFPTAANAVLLAQGGGGGSGGPAATGLDVSYVQCAASLPTSTAFAIVGVNGGLANNLNPCLGPSSSYPSYTQSELYWALTATAGGTGRSNVQLYVNTADPGNLYNGNPIADWPTSGNTPYGACTTTTVRGGSQTYVVGANSDACAWMYGYNMAAQDASWLTSAADALNAQESTVIAPDTSASYPWWLDVETANSWQTDTTMNVADLQGMIAALRAAGATSVGVYSTSTQWSSIAGGTSTTAAGSLYGVPNWIPGATTQAGAASNCNLPSFTGGAVTLTQWTGTLDNDYACAT
jgi:hypothetical protein